MSNQPELTSCIEAAALSINEDAFDKGDRLHEDQFVHQIMRRHSRLPWALCCEVVSRLAAEGRLTTITDRPQLHVSNRITGWKGIKRAYQCQQ
jgi:hypothetical protein